MPAAAAGLGAHHHYDVIETQSKRGQSQIQHAHTSSYNKQDTRSSPLTMHRSESYDLYKQQIVEEAKKPAKKNFGGAGQMLACPTTEHRKHSSSG